jgi:hypothetical protein
VRWAEWLLFVDDALTKSRLDHVVWALHSPESLTQSSV